jgi:diguanylate cyclase (GGDEF)-like protein
LKSDLRSVLAALRAGSPIVLDVPAQMRWRLLQRYLEMSRRNARLGMVSMLLLLFGLALEAPALARLLALGALIAALAARMWLAKRLARDMNPLDPRSNAVHDALVLIGSATWSVAPFLVWDVIAEPHLFGIAYGGFVAMAVISVSYDSALPASTMLVTCTFAPLLAFMQLQNTVMFSLLMIATLLCAYALVARVRSSHVTLLGSLAAEHENAKLVEELQSYRHVLESENASLGSSLRDASMAASRDALTNLHNRRYLASLVESLGALVNGHREEIAICMIDVDHFKRINDEHGHLVGDEVLRAVAGLLGARLRDGDCLARFGGEEFLALLRRCDVNRARSVAESLRQHAAAVPIESVAGAIGLTVSIGVAQWAPGEDFEEAVRRADRALYLAKRGGRDRIEIDAADGLRLTPRTDDGPISETLH